LSVTGDRQNEPWYRLVAQKLDYDTIYTALSETKYALWFPKTRIC
jgi:hypothetical protein